MLFARIALLLLMTTPVNAADDFQRGPARNTRASFALAKAIENNNDQDFDACVKTADADTMSNYCAGTRKTPLQNAVEHNRISMVQKLLEHKADPNISLEDVEGDTYYPLITAASEGNRDMVKLLVAHKASLTHTINTGDNALHAAIIRGHYGIAEYLLNYADAIPAVMNQTNSSGETPCLLAMNHNKIQIALWCICRGGLPLIIEPGGATWIKDRDGTTVLMRSAQCKVILKNGESAVQFVLSKVPSSCKQKYIDATDNKEQTALAYAIYVNNHQAVKELIAAKATVNQDSRMLMMAIDKGYDEIVTTLLKAGAQVTYDHIKHAESKNSKKLKKLLKVHKAQGGVDKVQSTQPMRVVHTTDAKAIMGLIARLSNPTCAPSTTVNPVAATAYANGPQQEMLPANPDTFSNIHEALRSNDCDAVEAFIDKKGVADINDALKIAIGNGSNKVIPLLMERGAKISREHVEIARSHGNTRGMKMLEALLLQDS